MPTRPKPSAKSEPATKGSAKTSTTGAHASPVTSRATAKTKAKAAPAKSGAKVAPKSATTVKKSDTKAATGAKPAAPARAKTTAATPAPPAASKRAAAKAASPAKATKGTKSAAPAGVASGAEAPAAGIPVVALDPGAEMSHAVVAPEVVPDPSVAPPAMAATSSAATAAASLAAAVSGPGASTDPAADAVAPTPAPIRQVTVTVIPSEVPASTRPPREPSDDPHPELGAEEWYQREKARRTKPLTNDLMAEARELLLQAVAEAGPRRGRPVRVGAAAKPKPKARAADDFDLDEYRPGEKKTT